MLLNISRQIKVAVERSPLLSGVRHKAAYEGEGKTTVRVLNQEQDLGLMIDSYSTYGFRLNNGLTVLGPMAIFPRTVLSWQIRNSDEIDEEALKLFRLLTPRIDVLIMGLETKERSTIDSIFRTAKGLALNVEILPTEHACSTFNFLNAEGRCVAAALLPPPIIKMDENDLMHSRIHYDNIYNRGLK